GRLLVGDLDHGATGELHRQVQAARHQKEHGQQEGDERDRVQHDRVPHERDVAADSEELHRGLRARGQSALAGVASPSGRHTVPTEMALSFFWRPYQKFTRPREKNTAENMLVTMPRQCTTAKPRTGPEPNSSSATPAISEVTLESRMVP